MNIKIDFKAIRAVSFYFVLFLLIFGLSNLFNDMDYDVWVRLIQGKHVVQTGGVMYHDILSYTPTHIWYDPEWLSSAFLYLMISKFGILSITMIKFVLMFSSVVAVTAAAAYVNKTKVSSLNLEFFLFVSILQFFAGSSGLFLRCQLFSYVLIPLWIILLEKINKHYDDKKGFYCLISLPFFMLLWLNIHGACIAGVGLMLLYILGRFLNKKPVKKYLYSLVFVLFVFLINPWGIDYIKFLIDSSFLDRSWIVEWQSIIGHDIAFSVHVAVLMTILLLIYFARLIIDKFKNINYSKMLFLLVTFYLGWMHFKHTVIFAIIAGIYLYEDYICLTRKVFGFVYAKFNINNIYQKYLKILKDLIVFTCVFGFALYYTVISPISDSVLKMAFLRMPLNIVEFINVNNIKGNMFLPYFYGSFMGYKTYPNIKIFMDGREEQVYDYDLFDREMFFMYGVHKNSRPVIEEYPPDLYMVEVGWQYGDYVANNPNYKLIYRDDQFLLYIRKELAKDSYKNIDLQYQFHPDKLLETKIDFRKK